MPHVLLDANVILRFTLDDHEVLSAQATAYFDRAAAGEFVLVVPTVTLAECVYTMSKFYKLGRQEIVLGLETLLSLPNVEPQETALRPALQLFAAHNLDFADAYLAALGADLGDRVASFDRNLGKLDAAVLE
ncbi:PIN domain-containing protein [Deinococcus lacus]|uniref:Ribonuclease VapC n=1 Tax=Deinococcus lacus TaxID=392561 RepID=A0ABW1YDU6_9DEIO